MGEFATSYCVFVIGKHTTVCDSVRKIFHAPTKLITLGDKSQTIIALTPIHTNHQHDFINKQTNKQIHRKIDNEIVTYKQTHICLL